MKKSLMLLVVLVILLGNVACSTYAANRYAISVDTQELLRKNTSNKVNVGEFTSVDEGATSLACRGVGPIKTPDGETFDAYVRKALVDELRMADLFSADGPVTLTGTLDAIEFSSTEGSWDLMLTVRSSNGNSLAVKEHYDFSSSFFGETACNQTAQTLMPAVQNLIGKLVKDPSFRGLLRKER